MTHWLLFTALAQAAGPADVVTSDAVTWVGVDYSRARFARTRSFTPPKRALPDLVEGWNYLVREELVYDLRGALHKTVEVADEAVRAPNASLDADPFSMEPVDPDGHLTEQDLAAQVGSYELGGTGLGLVFVVEHIDQPRDELCLYAVFFDVPSRQVLEQQRTCERGGGVPFRNHWFRPLEIAVHKLRPMMRAVRKERKNRS